MAVKIGNSDVSFKLGSADTKVYLGDTLLYPSTPPSFQGKWLATYTGGTTSSAECGASSAITNNEITKTDLVSVEIGDCVTSIGNMAFYSAASLVSIDIPDSVTSISSEAFRFCTSLTSCTIGSGITSIGGYAFNKCSGLASIIINAATPPTLPLSGYNYVFRDTNNCPIYVPASSVETYKSASRWKTYADRIQAIP